MDQATRLFLARLVQYLDGAGEVRLFHRAPRASDRISNARMFVYQGDLESLRALAEASDPARDTPGLVSTRHGDTARLAALKVRPRTGSQRHRVLAFIESCTEGGATRDEIAHALGMSPNTVRPRVRELLDGGHVRASEARRETALGNLAEVIVGARYPSAVDRSMQMTPVPGGR